MTDAVGKLRDGAHIFPIRVYYEDTDAGGVVYHANYLKFAERARTDLLRFLGVEQSRLAADDAVVFAVRRCIVDFFKPARLDDDLEVRSRITGLKGASLETEQSVCRGPEELVRLSVQVACVKQTGAGGPVRIPAAIRASLQTHFCEN